MKLHIGNSYSTTSPNGRGPAVLWPVDAVTETFGIFGMRGSGKSTTAKVLVEELTKAGQQCIVVDPLGVWWGLKSSADAKSEGLPFTIIGGNHADVPINDRAGALVADLVIETTNPLIIDLSQIRKAEGRRFMAAFLDQLWHRASGKPVHIVVDECDLYAPMRPIKGAEALLGSMEDLVRRGRNKGLGSTMISQRPASVHTDIRSQVSVLIAHRLTGTHDRAALDAWVEAHGDRDRRALMMQGVAALPTGVAWMWSPQFLELFAEVAVRLPDTFDSMATPKPGQRQIVPKKLAKADVKALTEKMASIIAEVEQNDVKALQRRIRELEKNLTAAQAQAQAIAEKTVERQVVEYVMVEPSLDLTVQKLANTLDKAVDVLTADIKAELTTARFRAEKSPGESRVEAKQRIDGMVKAAERRLAPQAVDKVVDKPRQLQTFPKGHTLTTADSELNGPMRKLLIVLATYGPRTKRQLAMQAGYSENGGAFANPLGKLRSMGYVLPGNPIVISGNGIAALGDFEPLPTGQALIDHWLNSPRFSGPMAKILTALIERWPKTYTRNELADVCGYAPSGGAFANPLGKLRTLGLVNKYADISLTEEFAEAIQ